MEYEVVFRTLDVERWGFSGPVSFAARGIVEAAMQAKQWAHDASKGGTSKGPFYTVHAIRDTYLDRSADVRYIELARVAAKPITELARSLAPSCFPPTHHVVATMLARELNNALHRKADGAYRAGFSDAACGATPSTPSRTPAPAAGASCNPSTGRSVPRRTGPALELTIHH